jgi:hypothetical protein
MKQNIEIPLKNLIMSFGLIFFLGVLFAILNGYYVEESGELLPFIVYMISLISILIGAMLLFLFKWKINKLKLDSLLKILPKEDERILKILLENNNSIEQNRLVVMSSYNKVKISRILTRYEKKGIIKKKNLGNTESVMFFAETQDF